MAIIKVDYGTGNARDHTNKNAGFAQFGWAHSAFRGGAEKVFVPKGFRLYKFTSSHPIGPFGITPWWGTYDPYKNDAGLQQRLSLARILGANSADLTGVMAAISEDWNGLTHILEAKLTRSVYGFWGQCKDMPRLHEYKKDQQVNPTQKGVTGDTIANTRDGVVTAGRTHAGTKRLTGYAWQFFIPNMKSDDIEFSLPYPAPDYSRKRGA